MAAETLILLVVGMQAFAFSLVPHIGHLLSLIINCCLNSFVLFEYAYATTAFYSRDLIVFC